MTAMVKGSASTRVDFSAITVAMEATGDPNMTAAMIEPIQPRIAAASLFGVVATNRIAATLMHIDTA